MSSVLIKEHEHVTIISINRPEARNALSTEVIRSLDEIFKNLLKNENTRAVIINGEGDKAFCAGADLKERQKMTEQEAIAFVEKIQTTFQKLASLPMPTIAAINGDAFGGGLELALACDIRVMNETAHAGLTECSLGIIPGAGGTQRLPQVVGISLAKELIFRAKRLTGPEALSTRLVSAISSGSEETKKLALKIAFDIAKNAPLAVRAAKDAINQSESKDMRSGLMTELANYHSIIESYDRKEGLRAFLEKRTPEFRGV